MTSMEYIRTRLETEYPDKAAMIMDELNKRFSEEQPDVTPNGEFEKMFQEMGAPFFLCALIMGEAEIPEAGTYCRNIWERYCALIRENA